MDEVTQNRQALKSIRSEHGFHYLIEHINELSKDGWDKFIDLSPEKKTSKAAFAMSAQYRVLKDLVDWIDTECKMA